MIYALIFGTIDLILLSPLIIAVTPFVIAAIVVTVILFVNKKKNKDQEQQKAIEA